LWADRTEPARRAGDGAERRRSDVSLDQRDDRLGGRVRPGDTRWPTVAPADSNIPTLRPVASGAEHVGAVVWRTRAGADAQAAAVPGHLPDLWPARQHGKPRLQRA